VEWGVAGTVSGWRGVTPHEHTVSRNVMEFQLTQGPIALLMAPAEGGSPAFALLVQLGLIFMIFYWLLLRPQRKERDKHEAMIGALKKGDEIVTVGGIVGTVVHVDGDRLTVKSAENTRLVVDKGKVGQVLTGGGGTAAGGSTA
jgi:preprotein translocase subunit YajC